MDELVEHGIISWLTTCNYKRIGILYMSTALFFFGVAGVLAAFALMFTGFNLTFFPMFFLGMMGMSRRIYTYPPFPSWGFLNVLSSCGAALMTLAVLLILANIVISLRKPIKAGDNPWNAYTLEWATSYPPPEFNFRHIPKITSEAPLLGMRQAEASEQNV